MAINLVARTPRVVSKVGKVVVVVLAVKVHGQANLMLIAQADRHVSALPRGLQRGEQDRDQQGDDGDHDQKLDQSKSIAAKLALHSGPPGAVSPHRFNSILEFEAVVFNKINIKVP